MSLVPAKAITRVGERDLPPGCFTFDPLGRDMPLFTQAHAITTLTERSDAINLPSPITHVAFADDLKAYRAQHRHLNAEEDGFTEEDLSRNSLYYGPERSLYVLLNGEPIPPRAVMTRLEPMECAPGGRPGAQTPGCYRCYTRTSATAAQTATRCQ